MAYLASLTTVLALLPMSFVAAEAIILSDSGEPTVIDMESETVRWITVFIPEADLEVRSVDVFADFTKSDIPEEICPEADVMISGGFYERPSHAPIGLVIEDGEVVSSPMVSTSGGYVFSAEGKVSFSKVSDDPPLNADYALQSQPFLIEAGEVDVSDLRDARWNRIAIGDGSYKGRNGIAVFAAIAPSVVGVQQHEFAEEIFLIAKAAGLEVDMVLNLDGSGSPFVRSPDHGISAGNPREIYMPNIICLDGGP